MKKKKERIRIKIQINYEDEIGYHDSLVEIINKLFLGFREGFDGNEKENYSFKVY